MSYYRYIAGIYKSDRPELNRTLRSSSVPRHVPTIDYCKQLFWHVLFIAKIIFLARYTRSTSVPPISRTRYAATPFRDRATSVPPTEPVSSPVSRVSSYYSHYTDFDYKVLNYMAKLSCMDDIKQYVSSSRTLR